MFGIGKKHFECEYSDKKVFRLVLVGDTREEVVETIRYYEEREIYIPVGNITTKRRNLEIGIGNRCGENVVITIPPVRFCVDRGSVIKFQGFFQDYERNMRGGLYNLSLPLANSVVLRTSSIFSKVNLEKISLK